VKDLMRFGLSERRGCALVGTPRSGVRYESRRVEDPELLKQVRILALRNPRYGYRRVWALLRRAGRTVNLKKVLRL
jgi:putative transposase